DAMIADVEAKYCIDKSKIFVHGYSSGAWETYLLGCARPNVVRGIGPQVGGGLRLNGPKCMNQPVAAIMVEGLQDTENPIGPTAQPVHDSHGSAPARDEILARNGCQGTATTMWDPMYPLCVKYTGCPDKYPVVWCAINTAHTPDMQYAYGGIWK